MALAEPTATRVQCALLLGSGNLEFLHRIPQFELCKTKVRTNEIKNLGKIRTNSMCSIRGMHKRLKHLKVATEKKFNNEKIGKEITKCRRP